MYEFLSDFGLGIAGQAGKPYIPIFIGAFLLILFDNWIGLVPPVGKIDALCAELEALLVPLNRAAARRVLGRFVRDHHRAGAAAPASDPPAHSPVSRAPDDDANERGEG